MKQKECMAYEAVCKLELSAQERDLICEQASGFEELFMRLDEIDVGDTKPLVFLVPPRNVTREDKAQKLCSRETILEGAIEAEDGCFRVPKTLD